MSTERALSAVVVLRPARGGELSGTDVITSDTIGEFLPDPGSADRAASYFRSAGFAVTEVVGVSFSITGSPSLFESVFGERPVHEGSGAREVVRTAGGLELPVEALPPDVSGVVQAVTFTPPPDFGPTNP